MNKIDRHNYEEYLILYLDNELDSAQRSMVEGFLALHPDLKEEFELLQQYKLQPDNIVFPEKNELLNIPAQAGEWQEQILLYLDNELPKAKRKELEKQLATNTALKKEFDLFLQTRMVPDNIVFANKEELYEKHLQPADKRRIGFLFNWRAAAAILILLAAGTTFILLKNKNTVQPVTAKTNTPVKPTEEKSIFAPIKIAGTDKNNNIQNPGTQSMVNSTPKNKMNVKNIPEKLAVQRKENISNNPVNDNNAIAQDKTPQPVTLESNGKTLNPVNTTDAGIQSGIADNNARASLQKNNIPPQSTDNPGQADNAFKQASYVEGDNLQENPQKTSKLRGFFRKATRFLEKRANIQAPDDGKVMVGSFAFRIN